MQSEQNHVLLRRRKFLTDSSMVLAAIAGSSVVGAGRFAWAGSATTETVEVETAYGRLPGRRNGNLITFKGVPYAVSGENRFTAPPPLVPWTGIRAALNMSEMWTTFAKTGGPNAKGQPPWPAYTLPKRATMMIDRQCKVEDDPFGPERVVRDGLSS